MNTAIAVTSPTLGNGTWHVLINESLRFTTDEISIFIAHTGNTGRHVLLPCELALSGETDNVVATDDATPSIVLPKKLAVALFEALSYALTGRDNVYAQIRTLQRDLNQANQRLDQLISGIAKNGLGK